MKVNSLNHQNTDADMSLAPSQSAHNQMTLAARQLVASSQMPAVAMQSPRLAENSPAQGSEPRTAATSGRDLFAIIPHEIFVKIMKDVGGPSVFRNAQLGSRYKEMIQDRAKDILFPHLDEQKDEMLANLLNIQEIDVIDGIKLDRHRYTDAKEMIQRVCEVMTLLVSMVDRCFESEQKHLLHTQEGFDAANAYCQFLNHFGSNKGALIHDGAMIANLYIAFEECTFLKILEQKDPPYEKIEQARRGLLRFLNSLCFQEKCFDIRKNPAFEITLEAYEKGNQLLMKFMDTPGSNWYEKDYPRYHTVEALTVGDCDLNAWMLKENSPWLTMSLSSQSNIVHAFKLKNEKFNAWIMQDKSPWSSFSQNRYLPWGYEDGLSESEVMVKAVAIGNSSFTDWILQKNSPWLAMSCEERILTMDRIKSGDSEINAWIMKKDSVWLNMDQSWMSNMNKMLDEGIPAIKELLIHNNIFWSDKFSSNLYGRKEFFIPSNLLIVINKINTSFADMDTKNRLVKGMLREESYFFHLPEYLYDPVIHAIEKKQEDLLALYFGDVVFSDGWTRDFQLKNNNFVEKTGNISLIGNATANCYLVSKNGSWPKDFEFENYRRETEEAMKAIFSGKNQDRIPAELKEKLVHFLFDPESAWRTIANLNSFRVNIKDLQLESFTNELGWETGKPEKMLLQCMERGSVRVLNWILKEQQHLHRLPIKQMCALALAAKSDNERFFNFITQTGRQNRRMSADRIVALHDLFEKAQTDPKLEVLLAGIELDPLKFKNLLSLDMPMVAKYTTLNPDTLSFARANDEVLSDWDTAKVAITWEAFDLIFNPKLADYILRGRNTWNTMTEAQMVQTIRAFKTGNSSLIKKIVDNKKNEHWHSLSAEKMAEINHVMETGSGLQRVQARRGKWV